MPGDVRRISVLACVFLVLLRLMVGWHLLYEGLWKLNTVDTSTPWSAEGYLKNATGPFRDYFRNLTGDPNDLNWLDYDRMAAKWDRWHARYLAHYPNVNEATSGRSVADQLNLMLNGPKEFAVELDQLPAGVDLARWKSAIRFDAAKKRLIVNGEHHMLPDERDAILKQAPQITDPAADEQDKAAVVQKFHDAINRAYTLQSRLSYKERLAALLKGDPERVGILQQEKDGAIIEQRMGDVERYKKLIARYEANYARAKTAYQWDHLATQWKELQQLRRDLVGPVQALENQLKTEATELLSAAQLQAGPVPEEMTPIRSINLQTMWGLTILGALLMAGLLTRVAALGAAGLLSMFYLAAPPWLGVPPDVGVEHTFIVNKVLMEIMTCLVFVVTPTGSWFGIDAIFAALFRRRPRD